MEVCSLGVHLGGGVCCLLGFGGGGACNLFPHLKPCNPHLPAPPHELLPHPTHSCPTPCTPAPPSAAARSSRPSSEQTQSCPTPRTSASPAPPSAAARSARPSSAHIQSWRRAGLGRESSRVRDRGSARRVARLRCSERLPRCRACRGGRLNFGTQIEHVSEGLGF